MRRQAGPDAPPCAGTLGAGRVVGAPRKPGAREVEDVREVRSLGLEMVRLLAP